MRSKTLLKSIKSNLQSHPHKPKMIVIAGVAPGVGVTHTAILLGNYLRRLRLKVAIVEGNPSGAFSRLEESFEGSSYEALEGQQFSIKRVDYYKSYSAQTMGEVENTNYDVIIIDVGHQARSFKQVFKLADYPMVVGQSVDWKRYEHKLFLESNKDLLNKRVSWILPFAGSRDLKELRRLVGCPCYQIGYNPDPFIKIAEVDNKLRKVFRVR